MDPNNLHTSVVIELANQEDGNEQNSYKTDFDEMETPKDYVIDQIFCGENITVYALFEMPEIKSRKSDEELAEKPNLPLNDNSRFIQRNSFKKMSQKNSRSCKKKPPLRDCDEDIHIAPKKCSRNKSFYCLKHLSEDYKIPHGEEASTDLKVLFSKDFFPKDSKQVKFKGVSKGVNTDIAQTPKIIDDIQRAINVNFSRGKGDEKTLEITMVSPVKPFCEVTDADMQQSFSSFSSISESIKCRQKSSPNFLFVPLLMIEDKFMNQFQRDVKSQFLPEEKIKATKAQIIPTKVSFGTNTEVVDCSHLTSEKEEKRGRQSHNTSLERFETGKEEESNEEKEIRNGKSHLKKKDKDIILNEIRKLQRKLNTLIKSIEHHEFSLSAEDDANHSESEKKTSDPQLTYPDSFRRNQNRFDDIPVLSPMSFFSTSKRSYPQKKIQNDNPEGAKKEISLELVKSVSSSFLLDQKEISTLLGTYNVEKPKVKLKSVLSGLNIDWEVKGGKGVGPSKSVTSNRCSLSFPKYNCIKKSLSFDLRDDKIEMCCLKKMKNSSFKLEGSIKANMRIIQNGEVRLGETLTSLTREMGDEAKTKLRVSKTALQNLNQKAMKEEIFLTNNELSIKKNLNEEEGDAKLIYPNQNLISPKFVQNPEVHFCKANAIVSDALLKSVKIANGTGKSKTVSKTEESGLKVCSDTEKPATPSRTLRKNNAMDSDSKKEVKPIKKFGTKNKTSEKKSERRETISHEVVKPKSISASRRFALKGTAESKLHVDKLIKTAYEPKNDVLANSQKLNLMKPNPDEKSGGRTDRLHRPCSRKRDLRENLTEVTVADRKETEKKAGRKKSETLMGAESPPKKSSPDAEVKENVSQGNISGCKKGEFLERKKSPLENGAWMSSNSSSVVVELFSEKPALGDEFYAEISQEYGNALSTDSDLRKSNDNENQVNRNVGSHEKPIVKSVWALTKVLLFEDGTKKLEVLEASLTPPGYSLQPIDNKPTESTSERKFKNFKEV